MSKLRSFTGSEAGSGLSEQDFLARQAADPQHLTMSQLKASLGLPEHTHEVADVGALPFSGARVEVLGSLTTSGRGAQSHQEPLQGAHLKRKPLPPDIFKILSADD